MMKTRKREIKIIVLLSIIVLSALAASPQVTINYVSASLNSYSRARGSRGGGTVVYISGVNFSPIAGDISIFFGDYPCNIVAEGSNVHMVSCITSPMTGADEGKRLPITMHTVDLLTVKCTKNECTFTYFDSNTPIVNQIYPHIAAGNEDVTFFGEHRISNIGDGRSPDASDLRYLLIGDTVCSNLDIIQEDINPNSDNPIYCKSFLHQQAGEYNATEKVVYGDAIFSVVTKKISLLTNQFYAFRIAPWIDSTTVIHSGGANGHILHLAATGLSNDQSKIEDATCKIGSVSCSVLSMSEGAITIELPPYQTGYENLGKLTQDLADSEVQELSFLGSAGFKYTRYKFSSWKNIGLLIYDFRAKNQSQTVIEEGYSSQLSYLNRIGVSSFVDYQRGYFYAHADGQYLFQATVDDQIVVYLSKYQGTANIKHLQLILRTDDFLSARLDPYQRITVTTLSTKKTLQKGYYYMQVIARDGGGYNYYYVNVATPPLPVKANIPNPTWQIVNVKIAPRNKNRQIITITVDKAAMGTTTKFNLFYLTLSNDKYVKVSSADITVGATASEFQSAYDNMPQFDYGAPSYQLKMYDTLDAVTTVTADAVKFVYTITYQWIRPSTYASLPSTSDPAVVATNIQKVSPGLAGTYTFSINGAPLTVLDSTTYTSSSTITITNYLPYLGTAIQNYYPGSQISIITRSTPQIPNQLQFDIVLLGVKDPLPMTIDTTALTGGSDNIIDAVFTQKRAYSADRPYFYGIPYDMLRTGETKPAIQIEFNKMPALCVDCTYSYQPTSPFSIVSAAFIGFPVSGMSLTLAYTPSLVTFDKATDVVITLYGEPCNIINQLFNTYTCTFNTITTNQGVISKLPAGNDIPKVHIKNYGYATVASTLKLKNQMTISSITPLVMGFNGEVTVTAKGTGFPVSNQGYPKLHIKTDANNPTDVTKYISITNTQVDFKFPAVTGSPASPYEQTVIFELQYPSYTYSYTSTIKASFDSSLDPTVTALSVQSASPILKQTIDVTGTNFDPDITKMRAFLYFASNQTMKYQITILPDGASTTQIKCLLGGGRTGDYNLRVEVIGKGISAPAQANAFSYKIVVNSVSPVTGTLGGGYTLTINGANFATASGSTNVFIGNGMNSICKITTITATKIQCTVPQMNAQYKSGDQQTVLVTGRINEESLCEGTCIFTYQETGTIHLKPLLKTEYLANEVVTVQADGSADISTATVKVGTTSVTLSSAVGDTITFPYPPLAAGSYDIVVTVNGNNAYPILSSSTVLSIDVISSISGSNKGQILNVIGNGFSTKQNPSNQIQYICSGITTYLPIITMIPTNVTFQVPSNPLTSCTINVTMGLTFKTYTYTQSAAKTPSVVVTQLSSFVYQITASNTNSKSVKFMVARFLDTSNGLSSSIYPFSFSSTGSNQYSAQPQTSYFPCGTFKLEVHFDGIGYADSTTNTLNSYTSTACQSLLATTVTPTSSSFNGGNIITINQPGFITNNIQNNDLRVCKIKALIKEVTQTSLSFFVPPFVNQQTRDNYGLGSQIVLNSKGNIVFDSETKKNYPFDKNTRTYYQSSNEICFIGLDFGTGVKASIRKIRFFPNSNWIIPSKFFLGAVLEGSNDNTVWTPINQINTQQVHTGWNTWIAETSQNYLYQYVRFRHVNTLSGCQLSELEFTGIIFSNTAYASSLPCPLTISFNDASKNIQLASAVTYQDAKTSTVTNISPSFGPSVGGTVITITGTNFEPNTASASVVIDGIACVIGTATSTQIVCTTAVRSSPPNGANTFDVISFGSKAILKCQQFLYIDRWSSSRTWGDEALPRDGDTVYVPKGMALLIDQSTPHINLIYVDGGKVIFADETDMTLDANYFIFLGGEFRAGLPSAPYQHKLTITLHGGYYDKQLPYFGNKVLGCQNCRFNMHGKVRTPTWTQLAQTITPGSNTVKLIDAVDWVAGEHIAVAASGYNHFESEERIITTVADAGKTLTVDKPFTYRHFSGIQTYGGKDFIMRAEVGLLTRNIVIQGDNMSEVYNHGSHLMFMGKAANGLDATLSYTEITQCGQPKIVGRYCSHFHMAGEVPNSFVRGIAVHHSHARVLTIHGTHYLLVEKNVGFLVKGHNIFIEDGIETRNIIQDNLMISSIASLTMLQSDTSVASYWITNPFNTVRRNHAAGGDFYGFWYEIKPNPDGPSATPNICPTGMQLGESANNVAHSNRRFGLRIFVYAARQFPCTPVTDEYLLDPFSANPAYQSIFDSYLLWKNQQSGFLGEQMGYVTAKNFLIIDSGFSGMEFFKTNITKEPVTVKDTVIVGISAGNPPDDLSDMDDVRGIITPRTDGLRVEGVTFVNFGAKMTPLQSCSQCQSPLFWVTGGKSTFFKNIKYVNIQGNYIFWNGWRRQIFVDQDGSLTKPIADSKGLTLSAGTITPYFDHLNIPSKCYNIVPLWDNSSFCDNTITIRSLLYTNVDPINDFVGQTARTALLSAPNDPDAVPTYDVQPQIIIKKSHDIKGSWAYPYAVGRYYHTHFQFGIDFLHMSLAPSQYWGTNEGIVVRFNYTDVRQFYNIGKYFSKQLQQPLITAGLANIDPTTCANGDYYHDKSTRHLYVCVSGKNKAIREWIDITGIRCQDFCPKVGDFGPRQDFTRVWSNVTQWTNGILPAAGNDVTIPYEWNIVLDMDTPALGKVIINGLLYFKKMDLTFQAKTIWVNQGGIFIGKSTEPFPNKATIILNGEKDDPYTVIDAGASGNKMLAVTGGIQFYGISPKTVWTRLTTIASKGASTITVQNLDDWVAGQQIVIGPTYSSPTQDQVFKIVSIAGKVITLNDTLKFEHYGAPSVVTNSKGGKIDLRAAVGMMTRNIKITKGPDANNWGCRVLVYSYLMTFTDPTKPIVPVNGYAIMDGVQMDGCGQYDTSYAGLRIQNIGKYKPSTNWIKVTNSAIRNCNGNCGYIDNSQNIIIDNNIFHFARRYTVYVLTVDKYTFTNNVLIGLRNRPQLSIQGTGIFPENTAYNHHIAPDYATCEIVVNNNYVQGSQQNGFVFPFTSCDKMSTYPFAGNTAGSCVAGIIANVLSGKTCIGAAGFSGYANEIGFIANPPGGHIQVEYENMFFVDNQRGFTLRYAHETDDNTIILRNSYMMGYSRPTCPSCYSDTTISFCKSGYAIRMFTATISGQTFPFNKDIHGFDVICTQQSFDAKAFLTNVTFQNYKYSNTELPYCSQMSVFRKHDGASDATANHNLRQSQCINCDVNGLVYFSDPQPGWSGWKGGCGQMLCTGSINYLIYDQDGMFTKNVGGGSLPSQLMANNQPIGNGQTSCTKIAEWNGYWCKSADLATFQYQSIAADFNSRMVWPVTMKYDGGSWTSVTNGWRQWVWIALNEPGNKRLARFWTIVKLGKQYNLTYASQPPSDAVYQIQKRSLPTGNPDDWIVVRMYFPVPNAVLIRASNTSITDQFITGFKQVNGVYPDLKTMGDSCGANHFNFQTNIISFVVNGKNNCKVRVTLASYLQLTVRLNTNMATFYSNDGQFSVLSKIIAFLKIDPSQLKIVGVRSGSVILSMHVFSEQINNDTTVNTNTTDPNNKFFVQPERDVAKQNNELTKMANSILTAIKSQDLKLDYPVISTTTQVTVVSTSSGEVTVCPETFLYDTDKKICYCDKGYANIDKKCISCILLGNTTGNADPANQNQCECPATLVWSSILLKCTCTDPNMVIGADGKCFNCKGLANSKGKPETVKKCLCNPTFVFTALNTCSCPDPESFIDGGVCYGCSAIGINSTGKVLAGQKQCQCKETYIYAPVINKCYCQADSYVDLDNKCKKCLQDKCRCTSNLVFKPALGRCACFDEKSAVIAGVCYSCVNDNSTGVVIGGGTECQCKFPFSFLDGGCRCHDLQSVLIQQMCFTCRTTNYNMSGKGLVPGTNDCSCRDQFDWDPTGKCVCGENSMYMNNNCYHCDQFPNTFPTLDTGIQKCLCKYDLVFDTVKFACACIDANSIFFNQVCTLCTSTAIRGLARVDAITCSCDKNLKFVWDRVTKTCACDAGYYFDGTKCSECKKLTDSTAASILGVGCVCKPTLSWDPLLKKCFCNGLVTGKTCLSCDRLIGAVTLNPDNKATCSCVGQLTWDALKKQCLCGTNQIITYQGSCVTCSTTLDANINGASPVADRYNCKCADPFFWDNIQNKCIKCGTGGLEKSDSKVKSQEITCKCIKNFAFDVYTNKCLPVKTCTKTNISECMNCALIPFGDGMNPSSLVAGAYSSVKDTSSIKKLFKSVTSNLSKIKSFQCYCSTGFVWDTAYQRCRKVLI